MFSLVFRAQGYGTHNVCAHVPLYSGLGQLVGIRAEREKEHTLIASTELLDQITPEFDHASRFFNSVRQLIVLFFIFLKTMVS